VQIKLGIDVTTACRFLAGQHSHPRGSWQLAAGLQAAGASGEGRVSRSRVSIRASGVCGKSGRCCGICLQDLRVLRHMHRIIC